MKGGRENYKVNLTSGYIHGFILYNNYLSLCYENHKCTRFTGVTLALGYIHRGEPCTWVYTQALQIPSSHTSVQPNSKQQGIRTLNKLYQITI